MLDLLDNPASPETIEELHRRGLLSPEARDAAHNFARPHVAWARWLGRWLLVIGAVLTLAGLVCFVAYNWKNLGNVLKLGGSQVLVLACALGAWRVGLERLLGKILLTSACLLVGIALALYGQIYQTGADTYELFLGWAVLIFGWVLISRFAALWFLWLVLLNLTVGFYWEAHKSRIWWSFDQVALTDLSLAVLNLLALAAREWAVTRNVVFLKERWLRTILVFAVLGALFVPSVWLIIDQGSAQGWVYAGATLNAVFLVACFLIYRRLWPDISVLGLCALDLSVLVIILVGRLVFDRPGNMPEELGMLGMAIVVLVMFGGAALWLRNVHREMLQPARGAEVADE